MKTILALAAGCAAAALFGAPSAQADINISGVNIGNDGNAQASFGNVAVALPGGNASATGGVGNVAFAASGAEVLKDGPGSFNIAAGGSGSQVVVGGNSNFNIAVAGANGEARITNSNATIAYAGRDSEAQVINANATIALARCGGTAISAQSARISVSTPCGEIGT